MEFPKPFVEILFEARAKLAERDADPQSNGGLIVTASAGAATHSELIIMLAARHRLPAVYPFRYFVTSGGLISYGPD